MNDRVTKFFQMGDNLPEESDCLWLITNGVVKSYTVNRENKTIVLGFWGKDEIVGKSLSNIDPYYLQCITCVRAIAIPFERWDTVSTNLLNRIRQIQELSCIIRNPQINDRLWLFLKWLGNKLGKKVLQGQQIFFKITEKDLSDTLGIEVNMISEILERFQREGLILRTQTQFIVLKKD